MPRAKVIRWVPPRCGRDYRFTIERRFIGPLGPGLLLKWNRGLVKWHVYRRFKTAEKRDAVLKRFGKAAGREYCAANFEYRQGADL